MPEALGRAQGGTVPGMLVPLGEASALTDALGRWLDEPRERERLVRAAVARRPTLPGWDRTSAELAAVLARLDVRMTTGARR